MQLAPVNPVARFVDVQPLKADDRPLPMISDLHWKETPVEDDKLVSVRYTGTDGEGRKRQVTVRDHREFASEQWKLVLGTFDEAVRAARSLAVVDGFSDDTAAGVFGRSSVAVLDAGKGVWNLVPVKYTEGMGDGMDAVISMPIDAEVTATGSEVSVPYGAYGPKLQHGFDRPDKVQVRFDDERVAALVGKDAIAVAPGH